MRPAGEEEGGFSLPAGHRITLSRGVCEDEELGEEARHAPAWMRYLPRQLPAVPTAPIADGGEEPDSAIPPRAVTRALRQSGAPPFASGGPGEVVKRKYRVRSNQFGPPEQLPALSLPSLTGTKRRRRDDPLNETHHGEVTGGDRAVAAVAADTPGPGEEEPRVHRRRVHSSHVGEVAALLSFTNLTKKS